jgi:pimeloyl-ACP methyl ester carboxylesterase
MTSHSSLRKENHHGCLFWLARAMIGLIIIFVLLLVAGAIYQAAGSASDSRRFPPPGELVDVGGYRLHVYCIGEGSPTIILDHLGDGNSMEWALIQPELAKTNRTCAYDRAGFGWSDPGPEPRTAGQSAAELHMLLEKAGINGPYVLVGHSYATDVLRLFASRYPQDTTGVVMVDPGIYASPDLPPELAGNSDASFIRAAPLMARFGLMRLADGMGVGVTTGDLPPDQASAYRAMRQKTSFWDQLVRVDAGMAETSVEVQGVTSLGSLPLIVLNADQPDDAYRRAWTEFNRHSAALSQQGEFRIVTGADHASIVNQKIYAAQVVQAVLDVLGR